MTIEHKAHIPFSDLRVFKMVIGIRCVRVHTGFFKRSPVLSSAVDDAADDKQLYDLLGFCYKQSR